MGPTSFRYASRRGPTFLTPRARGATRRCAVVVRKVGPTRYRSAVSLAPIFPHFVRKMGPSSANPAGARAPNFPLSGRKIWDRRDSNSSPTDPIRRGYQATPRSRTRFKAGPCIKAFVPPPDSPSIYERKRDQYRPFHRTWPECGSRNSRHACSGPPSVSCSPYTSTRSRSTTSPSSPPGSPTNRPRQTAASFGV
jgi:hypothetical protein